MSSIERVGFFHFGADCKDDPLGSLVKNLAEYPDSETANSLIVLPEGFNVRGGFYVAEPALDHEALGQLQALSARRGITFVAGMMDQVKGRNLACLVEGDCPPVVLSRKQAGGRDCLYTPATSDETVAVLRSGVGITALICDDAGYAARAEEDRIRAVTRVKCLNGAHNVLCVPAFMTITDSVAIAELWAHSMTVILANGCASYPSVIRHAGQQHLSTRYRPENEIMLCTL